MSKKKKDIELDVRMESRGNKLESSTVDNLKDFLKSEYNAKSETSSGNSESFFKAVVEGLDNLEKDKIDANTEFEDKPEVFAISKMEVVGEIGNVPILNLITAKYKRNIISKERAGRSEKISALQRRAEEERAEMIRKEMELRGLELH